MSLGELRWGSGLFAFSPAACLFIAVVMRKPELVIIAIISAFSYLLSLLLSSIIWAIIPPLQTAHGLMIVVGVVFQALARWGLFVAYSRTESIIRSASHPQILIPLNDVTSSLAAGVGFGLMHCLMLFGSVLASYSRDSGVLYVPSCSHTPLVYLLAATAMPFTLLDVCYMMMTFYHLRRRSFRMFSTIMLYHLIASLTTLFNAMDNGSGCTVSLSLLYLVLLATLSSSAYLIWSNKHEATTDL